MPNNDEQLKLLLNLLGKNKNPPSRSAGELGLNDYILNSLNASQSDLLKTLMNDPKAADAFLKSTQAQGILKNLKNQRKD